MKYLGIFFLLMCSSFTMAQWSQWDTPVAVTDSSSDNVNAKIFQVSMYSDMKVYMFWEKSMDSSSTAIMFRKLYPGTGAATDTAIMSQPGVHYTNPVIVNTADGLDTIAYLFYETDQAGDIDIYYMKLRQDGSFHGPFPFATGAGNQKSFYTLPYNFNYKNALVWEDESSILTSWLQNNGQFSFLTSPVVIDSVGTGNPIVVNEFNGHKIFYLKEIAGEAKIFYSFSSFFDPVWSTAALYYDDGIIQALHGGLCVMMPGSITLSWQTQKQGKWGVQYWSLEDSALYHEYWSASCNKTCPADYIWMFGVKSTNMFGMPSVTFVSDSTGNGDIYVSADFGALGLINLSSSSAIDRNPAYYFTNEPVFPNTWSLYNVWESYRQGHWVLYKAKCPVPIPGAIKDNISSTARLSVSPNPFGDVTRINIFTEKSLNVSIQVVNNIGQNLRIIHHGILSVGENQLSWDGRDKQGNVVPAGLYVIKVTIGSDIQVVKVLKR